MKWGNRSKLTIGVLAGVVGAAVALAVVPALSNSSAPPAAAATDTTPHGIAVSGLGKVYGTPDTLHLDMGVSVTRPDVTSALNAASQQLDKVIAALKSRHVPAKDIQTSNLNVSPHYSGGNTPQITGYDVGESLAVTLRNLTTAGSQITAAVQAGGNSVRVDGLSVSLESNDALISAARDRAFADAKTKAEQYARLSGRSLGKVLSISEHTSSPPTPEQFGSPTAAGSAGAAQSIAIAPGQQLVDVSVDVVWDFA